MGSSLHLPLAAITFVDQLSTICVHFRPEEAHAYADNGCMSATMASNWISMEGNEDNVKHSKIYYPF